MPRDPWSPRRIFAGGWLCEQDSSIMALIWQVRQPDTQEDVPPQFEAEIIRGVDKIASLTAATVEELKQALEKTYGASPAGESQPSLFVPPPAATPPPPPSPTA